MDKLAGGLSAPPRDLAGALNQQGWSPRYCGYFLVVLFFCAFFYQLDRNVIYVLQESIKHELKLSDTRLGLVTGMAYGLCNGLAGLPMGWVVDRVRRTRLLPAIIALWSGMTVLTGFVQGFPQLLLARAAVGLAESGGTPSSLSLLSDVFPPQRRASRLAIYFSGGAAGTIVSSLAGAAIAEHYGWRSVFWVFGLPGLVLAAVILLTLREPQRIRRADQQALPLRQAAAAIWFLVRQPGLRMIYLGTAMTSLVSVGVSAWWISFMVRIHHLSLPMAGLVGSIGAGLCSVLAINIAGWLGDWARRRWAGGPLVVTGIESLCNFAFAAVALWTPNSAVMIAALIAQGLFMGGYIATTNAAVSEMAPAHLRGQALAMPVVITNLVGVTLGPLLIGVISDFSEANLSHLAAPLRIAMFAVLLLQIPVACIYLLAGRAFTRRAAAQAA